MVKKPNLKIMKKINADRVVSVSAIVVSVATVIMIFYQTNLMRQEQKSSVMPSLKIGYSTERDSLGKRNEKIWFINRGLGPAFIEKISIVDSSGRHDTDLYGYFKKIDGNEDINFMKRAFPGTIIPVNERMVLYDKNTDSTSKVVLMNYFKYPFTKKTKHPGGKYDKAILEVYYKNVYGDRWKVRSDNHIPTQLD